MEKCQLGFVHGPAVFLCGPMTFGGGLPPVPSLPWSFLLPPLENRVRTGSVPCSTGPSNIYSSHQLLPTASLKNPGHSSEAGEGRSGH